jgi:hypothetical protein
MILGQRKAVKPAEVRALKLSVYQGLHQSALDHGEFVSAQPSHEPSESL